MNKIKCTLIGLALAGSILTGCEEVLEKDLTDKNIRLFAPIDSTSTGTSSNTLGWETLDGANQYQLQLVSDAFDSAHHIWTDTILNSTYYTIDLGPGKYQWRVRGFNGSSTTPFCPPWTLIIHP